MTTKYPIKSFVVILFILLVVSKLSRGHTLGHRRTQLINAEHSVVISRGGRSLDPRHDLGVSLFFKLPVNEVILILGLMILFLGIIHHFVELKADFFELRRESLREQALKILKENRERLRSDKIGQKYSGNNPAGYGPYKKSPSYPSYSSPKMPYRGSYVPKSIHSRPSSISPYQSESLTHQTVIRDPYDSTKYQNRYDDYLDYY